MSIVASASSDANIKTIVSSSHQAKLNSFQRSAFLHGPPPSSSGAVSFYIYIYINLSAGRSPCWAPTDPMFLAFNVVCKKFLLSLSYFPVLWKKQMQQTPHTYPVLVLPILLQQLQLLPSTVSLVLYVPFVSRHVLMLASGYVLCFLCNLDVVDSMLINRYHRCIIRNYYISLSNMNLFLFFSLHACF